MKRLVLAAIVILFVFIFAVPVNADELADELEIDMSGLSSNLPENAGTFIEEHNISVEDTETMTEISFSEVMKYIWDSFMTKLKYPITVFVSLVCIIIICSLIESAGDSVSNRQLRKIYGIICTLCAVGIISAPLSRCIASASETLYSGSRFMLGYVPVFAGITASSGNITSAVSYSAAVLLVSEAAISFSANYIVPSLSICTALGIVESINPSFSFSGITEGIKKGSRLILGLTMTVFIGLLSLQSIIGTSADTVGIKAAKFMVSNCIPVVGGAVADAYTTLKNGLGILRSGTGFFGIAILLITVLPVLAEITAMRLFFFCAEALAEIFGAGQVKILLKNASSVLSIIFSVVISFSVMFVISTAVVMLVGISTL